MSVALATGGARPDAQNLPARAKILSKIAARKRNIFAKKRKNNFFQKMKCESTNFLPK